MVKVIIVYSPCFFTLACMKVIATILCSFLSIYYDRFRRQKYESSTERLKTRQWRARVREKRNAVEFLLGKSVGKRPLAKPRRRQEDNMKVYLWKMGYEDGRWMQLIQERTQFLVLNLRVLSPQCHHFNPNSCHHENK